MPIYRKIKNLNYDDSDSDSDSEHEYFDKQGNKYNAKKDFIDLDEEEAREFASNCASHISIYQREKKKTIEMYAVNSDGEEELVPPSLKDSYISILRCQKLREIHEQQSSVLKNRVEALRTLQLQLNKIELKYHNAIRQCEAQHNEKLKQLQRKRYRLLNGLQKPRKNVTPKYNQLEYDFEQVGWELYNAMPHFDQILEGTEYLPPYIQGIPNFWLTVFRNSAVTSELISPVDTLILRHLIDVKILPGVKKRSFTLKFKFSQNEYFSNRKLKKKYLLKNAIDKKNPFNYEGPYPYKSIGCTIDWYPNEDVTQLSKLEKDSEGEIIQVADSSFFNFFSPPNEDEEDEESNLKLEVDFKIGFYIRERLVPDAIRYYTGELNDDELLKDDEDSKSNDSNISVISETKSMP